MKTSKFLSKWAERILNFLFPPECVVCKMPVAQGDSLCVDCFRELEPISAPFCEKCGAPFISKAESPLFCFSCLKTAPIWETGCAGLLYNPFARNLVLALKYSGQDKIAPVFVNFMLVNAQASLEKTDFVVPVPLHLKRLRKRGYNQSVLLGRLFAKKAGLDFYPDLLERSAATESLGKSSPSERRRILGSAIHLRSKYLKKSFKGRRAILIDDVMTSGATAEICTKALAGLNCSAVMVVVALRGRLEKAPCPETDK